MNASTQTQTQTEARPSERSADSRIGYSFDANPKRARELLEQGQISRTDYAILTELLKFQRAFRSSCWTTKATIAKRLDISPKTVQRSYRRLSEVGLIRLSEVGPPGSPDPDEPANRTGWRIHFPFVDAVRPTGSEPDRRPPSHRSKHACEPRGGEDTNVLGGEDIGVLPPQDTNVPQFRKVFDLSLDGTQKDNNNQTDHACESSSFFAPLLDQEFKNPPELEPDIYALADEVPAPEPPAAAPSTHVRIAAPARPEVELPVLPEVADIDQPAAPIVATDLEEAGVNQALLTVMMARLVALSAGFVVGANWTADAARKQILGLMRLFKCPLWWVDNALAIAERRQKAKSGNKRVESAGFIHNTLLNWSQGKGDPGSPPPPRSAPPPVAVEIIRAGSPHAPAPPRENYNPGIGWKDVEPSPPGAGEILRALIARTRAELPTAPAAPRPQANPRLTEAEMRARAKAKFGTDHPDGREVCREEAEAIP